MGDPQSGQANAGKRSSAVCSLCNDIGHKGQYCQKATPEQRAEQARIENDAFFKVTIIYIGWKGGGITCGFCTLAIYVLSSNPFPIQIFIWQTTLQSNCDC